MYNIIESLLLLKKYFQEKYQNRDFSIPYSTMNLSSIHRGDAINQICSLCILNFEIRLISGLSLTQIKILIQKNWRQL